MGDRCCADRRRFRGSIARLLAVAGAVVISAGLAGESLPAEQERGSRSERREAERRHLDRVRSEIAELQERLRQVESQAGSILDSLDAFNLEIALVGRQRNVLRQEQNETLAREATTRGEAAQVERRLAASEERLRGWMRETYKLGPMRYLRIVAAASSPSRVAAAHRSIEALSLGAGRRVEEYRIDRARLEELTDALAKGKRRLARLQDHLEDREESLVNLRHRKELILASVRKERTGRERALNELLDLESDIQDLLAALRDAGPREPIADLGFERFHGLLSWPLRGAVAVPFGNVRHPKFGTEVPHSGIDITARAGLDVAAVFDGRVVFSDWFRGYGPMIVVDHGDGYLSVYGHLGLRLVDVDDNVRQGDVIAHSGEGGTFDNTGLYFEIRHDGMPQDPALWLLEPRAIAAAPMDGAGAIGREIAP